MTRPTRTLATLAALALATSGTAQERPAEQDLFGAPPPAQSQPPPSVATPTPDAPRPRSAPPADATPDPAGAVRDLLARTDNPLAIGGQVYLRSVIAAREGQPPSAWSFTAPSLLDTYLDARPTDRVRGFVLGRMLYDPTIDPASTTVFGLAPPANPRVLLDQLWLRFDVEKTVFVTAGKQHVKWGTGRFWNPTDYLHTVRRDPLAVFDPRTGTYMVRAHVPWERRGWNFSAMAILEPLATSAQTGAAAPAASTSGTTANGSEAGTLGGIGGAARAEIVVGPAEIGAGAVLQRGHAPRFAIDASGAAGELDLYGEAALKSGTEIPVFRPRAGVARDAPLIIRYERYEPSGVTPAVTLGARWSHRYSDEDSFEVGAEYFFNDVGYDDPRIYPWLIVQNAFAPFYVGRHYAGVYLYLPKPGAWNQTTFVLSTIGNLSDRSFVTRLDHSVLLLTYLRLETFVQVHYGARDGEFRLAVSVPAQDLGTTTFPGFSIGPSIVDVGVALRVSL